MEGRYSSISGLINSANAASNAFSSRESAYSAELRMALFKTSLELGDGLLGAGLRLLQKGGMQLRDAGLEAALTGLCLLQRILNCLLASLVGLLMDVLRFHLGIQQALQGLVPFTGLFWGASD